MAVCRCCCPQIPVINNSPFATTVKVSPDGGIVWYFDSGYARSAGHLVADRYFALAMAFSGATFNSGRMSLLGLDGSLLADNDVPSTAALSLSGGNTSVGSAGLASGGCAFVGDETDASNTTRAAFWDVDGTLTGAWTGNAGELVSDIAPVDDNVCLRMDSDATGLSLHYRWIDPTGTQVGTELNVANSEDTIFAGNIQSFGSQVMLCGQFDVNANGTYQSATDHRYRMYGSIGAPEASGVIAATGDTIWATRYGSNAYALCVPISAITKITTGGTVTRNTISGFAEASTDVRDVKEDSSGNVAMASSITLYQYSQSGGAANWTASLAGIRRLACDANGNTYALAGTLKKYNSAGTLQWTATVPTIPFSAHSPNDRFGIHRNTSMHIDDDGFIYITGARVAASTLG